ncbi:MAG TPA: Coenzyme F420 hydrogenase/dehydrogenase, beta subunit C-terminal domain [Coriobacteriia bacterium]|nr:Coenzyme F420 hydrogenase/dehydrogenase, beta subunit C-terminal domain [Coriobacteriia bacterium]
MTQEIPTPNVGVITEAGLCLSCEACRVVCPTSAVRMAYASGELAPLIDASLCTHCGRCAEACPGLGGARLRRDDSVPHEWVAGEVLAAYAGFVRDDATREGAVSGGIATGLSAALLRSGAVDSVLAAEGAGAGPLEAGYRVVTSEADLAACQGSRYIPVSLANALDHLAESDGRSVFVGTACQIGTVKRFLSMRRIDESRVLFVGLVCDMTMGRNFVRYIERGHAAAGEQLVRLDYRTKLHFGWPGGLRLEFDSGREEFVGRDARLEVKDTFRVPRCLYCADKLNRDADLVVGDCYVGRCEDKRGSSTVLVRTARGAEVLASASDAFELQPVSVDEVLASQGILARDDRLAAASRLAASADAVMNRAAASLSISGVPSSIARLDRLARLGQSTGDPARTRRSLRSSGLRHRAARLGRRLRQFNLIGNLMRLPAPYVREARERSTAIIVGGHFENRGAQAMVFSVADGIRRFYPGARIVLASSTPLSAEAERYRIDYLPWPLEDKLAAAHGDDYASGVSRRISESLDDAFCMVDVSGFRLASVWGVRESLDFCVNLLIARRHGIPSFVMPQSFGPFDYAAASRMPMRAAIRAALRSAQRVWAREPEGAEALHSFAGVQAELHPDIVLGHGAIDPQHVYRARFEPRLFLPDLGSVAVVPSLRIVERSGGSGVYTNVIDELLARGKRVVLLSHSAEDHAVCLDLAREHSGDERVSVFAEQVDAVELEHYLSGFDFIVSSRYHSIIHAYKQGVPAVMLGWAVKYRRLAEIAGQSRYVVDLSADNASVALLAAVRAMLDSWVDERASVERAISKVSSSDLYEAIADAVVVPS